MLRFLLISTFLISNCCYGQHFSDTVISVLNKEQRISKVLSNPAFVHNEDLQSWYSIDSIDFDVAIYSNLFNNKENGGRALSPAPAYHLIIYSVHDTIIFKSLSKVNYIQDSSILKMEETPVFSVVDSVLLLDFIKKHNNKYHSHWTLEDFFKRTSINGSFGFSCGGIVSFPTDGAYAIASFVKANDSTALRNLASSFSAEERAFGTAGLFFLSQRGQKLSNELLGLMAINRASQIKIGYCDYDVTGKQTMSKSLETPRLEWIYSWLVENKLL